LIVEPLASIAATSREAVQSMSEIVWAIDASRDLLGDLTQRMRRFPSDVFTSRNIAFTFHGDSAEDALKIGADVRRQVFLTFKECVNNMVRHSGCTEADIEFRREGDWLYLRLSDNGRGFDLQAAKDGHGLRNMRARIESIGGRIEVVS